MIAKNCRPFRTRSAQIQSAGASYDYADADPIDVIARLDRAIQ
jgi:hypothetical protein